LSFKAATEPSAPLGLGRFELIEAVVDVEVDAPSAKPDEMEDELRLQAARETATRAAATTRYIPFTPAWIRAVRIESIAETR
jgi:hypothetical protein